MEAIDPSERSSQRDHALLQLIGARLTSVHFGSACVDLEFDDSGTLRTFAMPDIAEDGRVRSAQSPGYRDALGALIGRVVERLHMHDGERIEIQFAPGLELRIPLNPAPKRRETVRLTATRRCVHVY